MSRYVGRLHHPQYHGKAQPMVLPELNWKKAGMVAESIGRHMRRYQTEEAGLGTAAAVEHTGQQARTAAIGAACTAALQTVSLALLIFLDGGSELLPAHD